MIDEPVGKLIVATSYSTKKRIVKGTKTGTTREVPVHPALAKIIAQWLLSGWAQMFGRPPLPEDILIPSRIGRHRNVNHMLRRLHQDLGRLGFRKRRQHDARRTFISLALAGGARKETLKRVTHEGGDVFDSYNTPPWSSLCEAVSCLMIDLRRGEVIALPKPRTVVASIARLLQFLLQPSPSTKPETRKHPESL